MTILGWRIDWKYLRLAYRDPVVPNFWCEVFALRCALCRSWSTGCSRHWFCGLCETCRLDEIQERLEEVQDMLEED